VGCVIFWIGQEKGDLISGDYLAIGVDENGFAFTQFNLGGGKVKITYDAMNGPLEAGWHTIRVHR